MIDRYVVPCEAMLPDKIVHFAKIRDIFYVWVDTSAPLRRMHLTINGAGEHRATTIVGETAHHLGEEV